MNNINVNRDEKNPWIGKWNSCDGYMRLYYTSVPIFAYAFSWQESRGYKDREQFNELDNLKKKKGNWSVYVLKVELWMKHP